MSDRYILTAPVPGGNAWWTIRDTQSHLYWGEDNFTVWSASVRLPCAEAEARVLLVRLNAPPPQPVDLSEVTCE